MKVKRFVLGLVAVILLAYAIPAFAGKIAPVNWQRGEEGTTWQEWYFNTDAGPLNIDPEEKDNPYGSPTLDIILGGMCENIDPGWLAAYCGRYGVWHSDFTQLEIFVPNVRRYNQYKEVWVEVGFNGYLMPNPDHSPDNNTDNNSEQYAPKLTAYIDNSTVPDSQVKEIFRCITPVYWCWSKLIIAWRIEPNPDAEEIYLAFHNSGADIDYVIVDTKCFDNETVGGEGCTPGYWKQPQHFDSWPAPYTPNTLFADVFGEAFPHKTLLQVLRQGGGGLYALGRHAVAALLNAASPDVSYDLTPAEVISSFQSVYPGKRKQYEDLKNKLEKLNEQGCPLN